jgi:hypothetical protein
MRNTLVPHLGHTPWVAGRLFFILIDFGFFISTFFLHFTQYACIWTSLRLRFAPENNINIMTSQYPASTKRPIVHFARVFGRHNAWFVAGLIGMIFPALPGNRQIPINLGSFHSCETSLSQG